MRTQRVRYRPPDSYPPDHPGRAGPMIVQRFVDTGRYLSFFRVLMLFDTPLYCQLTLSKVERVPLEASDEELEQALVANQQFQQSEKTQEFLFDADVIETAKQAARAVPEIPLKGVDVIREEKTGRTYVLEINPGGNTWHFSSAFLSSQRAEHGPEFERLRYKQFDALSSAAHALRQRVVREAS